MAKDSAPARSRTEQIWQVPVFLVGIMAMVAVWYARPHWQPSAAERLQRDLFTLQRTLDSNQMPAAQIERLLTRISSSDVAWTSGLHHLIGSGFLRLGESADDANPGNPVWQNARRQLEAVKPAELGTEEAQQWNYRMARLAARDANADPAQVVKLLSASMPADSERAEGQRLIGECYLRMSPPNEGKAREAFREFMKAAPPRTSSVVQSRVRLQLGQISLRLNDLDDARRTLERVGPDSSPEIYAGARAALAQTVLREGDWAQAQRYLEQARETKGISPSMQERIRFELATVYLRANRKEEAVRILGEIKAGEGNAAQAARLKLALLNESDATNADGLLSELEKVTASADPGASTAGAFTTAEIRDLCDRLYAGSIRDRRFDAAERIARMYGRMTPNRDRELLADTYRAWAETLTKPQDRRDMLHRAAEQVHALVASPGATAPQRREWLKQAVELDAQSGDPKSALVHFNELIDQVGGPDKIDAEIWLKKGQLHLAASDSSSAIAAFEQGLKQPGAWETNLRVELADSLLKEGRNKEAVEQLEANLKNPALQQQSNLRERTLYSLGDAHYQMQEWAKAIESFDEAVAYYSETGRAISARYYVGRSYWYIAGQEAAALQNSQKWLDEHAAEKADAGYREREQKLLQQRRAYRDSLLSAGKAFQEVEAKLDAAEASGDATSTLGRLWRNAAFCSADCSLLLGEYDAARKRFERLAERFEGKVEQLVALGQLYQCFQYQNQPEQARLILTQIRTVYITLKDEAYDSSASNRKKQYWAEWLAKMDGK